MLTSAALVLALIVVGVVAVLVLVGIFIDRQHLPAHSVDAALVFGCGLDWKAQARLQVAHHLLQIGVVRHVIVSGGVRMPLHAVTEAEWFRARLVERGVPADRVFIENRATNTAENASFSLPIIEAQGFRDIVLVMSDFEGIRCHLTARRAWMGRDVTIYDCHAPSAGRWNRWTWWLTREGWGLTWYTVPRLFRYGLLPYLWTSTGPRTPPCRR